MEWFISQEILRRVLDAPDLDLTDITFVADKKMQFPAKQRLRAGQIISIQLFRDLIWDSGRPTSIDGVSPLSVIYATMTQALRGKDRFVSLVWFWASTRTYRSLYAFDMRPLHHEVDLGGVHRRSLDALIKLLDLLVRRLPQTVTLVGITEGVVLFERDECS
ncbi:hypothetical protein AB5N19_12763 [Seiridium cardinale]